MATTVDRKEQLARLLDEEIELRNHVERVAAMRRELRPGPAVDEYTFREGPADLSRDNAADFKQTKLSELFAPGKDELVVYHLMFGPDWEEACPMCSMWIDGLNGIARHVGETKNFAVIGKADIAKLRAYAKKRGWHNVRLLSSYDTTFNRDMNAEDADGDQIPGVSVFVRTKDGIRHHYSKWAPMREDINRGIDLLSPVWNVLDLTPSGRGEWLPSGWWGFLDGDDT